jgi:hypothetical protein
LIPAFRQPFDLLVRTRNLAQEAEAKVVLERVGVSKFDIWYTLKDILQYGVDLQFVTNPQVLLVQG